MIEIKQTFRGGLDQDTSLLVLGKENYIDALNITRDAVVANQDFAITNVVGNRLVSYSLPAGTNKVIGAYGNELRNTIVYFVYNSNGNHSILQYNNSNRTVTKIFENLTDSDDVDILGFTEQGKITGVNIFLNEDGDLLFFLDSLGRPTTMNLTRFIAGEYTPVTRDIIDVGKRPPLSPPACVYDNDATKATNDLWNKLFRFKYRWVYDDNEKSTWGPISAVPYPVDILDEEFTNVQTNNNAITISLNSGPKNVKSIELSVSYSSKSNLWSDFTLVETINKSDDSIDDNSDFAYQFYNDSTYPLLDVNESILLFDYVPDLARAQEMPNGNVLVYGGITEGYDNDLEPNVVITIGQVAAGDGGTIGSLNGIVTQTPAGPLTELSIEFSGVPATGTVVNVYLVTTPGGIQTLVGTYTTLSGDVASNVAAGLEASYDTIGIMSLNTSSGNTVNGFFPTFNYDFDELQINSPVSDANTNSIPTWKWSTSRTLGIQYYDQKGKTNGVMYSAGITFPPYQENVSEQPLLPYINVKIYHVPPDWAYSYQFVITKEPTTYKFWETPSIETDSDYIYFSITNFAINSEKTPTVANVLSYTFQDGDRLRLIRRMSDGFTFGPSFDIAIEGTVVNPIISSVEKEGTFVKIKKVPPFSTEDYSSEFFIIELFRPGQQPPSETNQAFFEFGEQYQILNPTEATRVHGGEVTDQSEDYVTPAEVNLYEGDSYFRSRTIFLSDTGVGTFYVQDRNFVDFYISGVSSVDGRPTAIEINAKRSYYSTMVRFGQSYQPNTNINGLNRFYPANFDEYDYSFGDIVRLKVRDRAMRVFQKLKVGVVGIFNQIGKNPDGNAITIVTDQLLNPIQYYSGDWGIGDNATSLVSYNFADYFTSNIKGAVLRVSNDGITPISIIYKMNSWATENIPLRTGNYHIYGAFDQRLNNYVMALEAVGDESESQTLSFSEPSNSFESFLSFKPEMMVNLGTLFVSFKDGEIWTHDSDTYNSFYGVDYESSITPVFNENNLQKKTWSSVTEVSNVVWDIPLLYTNVNSYSGQRQESNLVAAEFTILEGDPTAALKRDTRSIGGKINGATLKGNYCVMKFRRENASSLVYLSVISVKKINSPLTVV